jgi:hypothetical protein
VICLLFSLIIPGHFTTNAQEVYDLVILNGRVIDPESRLDVYPGRAVRAEVTGQ